MVDDLYPQLLKGRYRLLNRIGEGGMGVVYCCEDVQTTARHAVKFLSLDQVMNKGGPQRFMHEARLLSHLSHPNIVHIYDYGVEDGLPYLIMELCLGPDQRPYTLKELQEEMTSRRLDKEMLLNLVPQMLAAVSLLHEKGLIHRDLKPENFLLRTSPDGQLSLKLSDFGLVALTGDEELQRRFEMSISVSMQDSVVKDRAWVGTYAFMSPEQKQGLQLDARSDVYSLGLILYRLSTGYERLNPELPTDINPELPEWLDTLIEKAVADDPAERWMTASKMVEYLPDAYRIDTRQRQVPDSRQAHWLIPGTIAMLLVLGALYHLLVPAAPHQQEMLPFQAQPGIGFPSMATPTIATGSPAAREEAPLIQPGVVQLLEGLSTDLPAQRALARQALIEQAPTILPHLREVLDSHDDEARRLAAIALGYLDTREAAAPLLAALYDGPEAVRRAAADSLAELREKAVPELTEALLSHDPTARGYALYALSHVGVAGAPAWKHALGSPIDSIRDYASEMLILIGEPAVPLLMQALQTDEQATRDLAIMTLAKIGPVAAPELVIALRHDDARVRAGAVLVLGQLRHVDAALRMIELFKDSELAVRLAAQTALIQLGEAAAPALLRVFREAGPTASEHATAALATIGEPAVGILMKAMMTEGPAVRHHVTDVLTRIGDPAVPQLIEVLNIADGDVRRQAARTLAAMHSTYAIRSLLRYLGSEDALVRDYATYGLSSLTPAATPNLMELLQDNEVLVYRNAQTLLMRIGREDLSRLINALDSPHPIVRVRLSEVLVSLQEPEIFPAILRALDDRRMVDAVVAATASANADQLVERHLQMLRRVSAPDARQRIELTILRVGDAAIPALAAALLDPRDPHPQNPASLLARLGNPLVLPILVRALRSDDDRYPAVNIAAARAIGQLQHLAGVPPLCRATRWDKPALREAAIHALARIHTASSSDTLIRALEDTQGEVRAAAADALASIGTPKSLDALHKATNDRDPNVRNKANQAIRAIQQRHASP